jgi:hypothetical protein
MFPGSVPFQAVNRVGHDGPALAGIPSPSGGYSRWVWLTSFPVAKTATGARRKVNRSGL